MDESRAERRLLGTLQQLLEIPPVDLRAALTRASDAVSSALHADKVDVFLHDPERATLVAFGVSSQPLSELEKKVGLDVMQLVNGGRAAMAFESGQSFATGRADLDAQELRGVKEALGVRSKIAVPIEVEGVRRGVLLIVSQQSDFFSPEDLAFAEAVAHWVGGVIHRAELTARIASEAAEQGRRAAADEIVTVLAHDLRNFLSPIEMRLQLLRQRAERDGRALDVRDADRARTVVRRLNDIIADLLDAARIDEGIFIIDLQPTELRPLLEEIAATLGTPDHPVVIESEGTDEMPVLADPARLRQCLENLIANALKHSPADMPVRVVLATATDGTCVRVDVVDRGPGIPHEMLGRIFERFVSGERREGGLGLGLYLAKRIAVLHGGDLTVASTPGQGTCFSVTLHCPPPARH